MTKYFKNVFGEGGDRLPVPDGVQPSGQVSYEEGFGSFYSLPTGDPDKLNVPREKTNELFYDVTLGLQQYQQRGIPFFITSAQNGGVPFSYTKYAMALYDAGSGLHPYVSLVAANTALPTDTTKWQLVLPTFQQIFEDTGSLNALEISVPSYGNAYAQGTMLLINPANTNSSDVVTLKINSLAATPVLTTFGYTLSPGDIATTGPILVVFSGTDFFLVNPNISQFLYSCYAENSVDQVFPPATDDFIVMDVAVDNPFTILDTMSNSFVVKKTGRYLVNIVCRVSLDVLAAGGHIKLDIFKNGSLFKTLMRLPLSNFAVNEEVVLSPNCPLYLAVDDYVQFNFYNEDPGSVVSLLLGSQFHIANG